jgi:hypothetical protein
MTRIAIVMSFPVEGWKGSAAVVMRQSPDGRLNLLVRGPAAVVEQARAQALACLSLDVAAKRHIPLTGRFSMHSRARMRSSLSQPSRD